jgi:hypothetical protein
MGGAGGGPTLVSLAVTPDPAAGMISGIGETQQFTAIGTFSDATTENLTDAVTWASDDAAVAAFGPDGTLGGVLVAVGPGTANVTATLGAVVSPNVPILVTFGADFTSPTLPAGITATRDVGGAGALIWPCLGAGTYLPRAPINGALAGSPIYEDRSPLIPPGWWNHRPYENGIPDPFNFGGGGAGWQSLGPFPFGAPAHTTAALATGPNGPFAPDGVSNVWAIAQVFPFPDGNHYGAHMNVFGLADPYASFPGSLQCWFKDNPLNPSNIAVLSGSTQGNPTGNWRGIEKRRGLKHNSGLLFVANGWERIATLSILFPPAAGGSFAGQTVIAINPSLLHGLDASRFAPGVVPGDADEGGSVLVAAAQATTSVIGEWYAAQAASDLPLIKGNIGGTQFAITTPANVIVNGEFDIQMQLVPGWQECIMMAGPSNPHPGGNPPWDGLYFFSAQTPDGELSLRYDDTVPGGKFAMRVRGVEVLDLLGNDAGMFANNDQVVTIHAWYKPLTTGECGIRFNVNGAFQPANTNVAIGAALAAPTSFYIMHKPFADVLVTQPWQMPGMVTGQLKVFPPGTSDAEPSQPGIIVHLGDSLIRSNTKYVATPSYVWTGREYIENDPPLIAVLAIGGATLASQLAAWIASPYRGDPNVAAVVIEGGINDIILGRTSAQILTDYQAIIDDVQINNPTAKRIGTQVAPAFRYFTAHPNPNAAAMETKRQTINTQLVDGTVTSLDDLIEEHITILTDADGQTLLAALDVGTGLGPDDGLHYATDGRKRHGAAERAVFLRQGLWTVP